MIIMIHYIYKIVFLCGTPENRYYIGKRSTDKYDNWDSDPYTGSGIFCYSYFEKYGKIKNITYKKYCLEENDSFEQNKVREKYWIGDLWETDPYCMNKCSGGCIKEEIPIEQYSADGTFIREWKSAVEVEKKLKINNSVIRSLCNNTNPKRHTAGGFIFVNKGDKPKNTKKIPFIGPRKVIQKSLDGKVIKEYGSLAEAGKAENAPWQAIQRVCNGKRKSTHGFKWEWGN